MSTMNTKEQASDCNTLSEKEKKANEKKAKKAQKEKQFKTSINSFFTDFKKFISKGNIVDNIFKLFEFFAMNHCII